MLVLFIELQVELPGLDLARGQVPIFIGETDSHLDQLQVVAVSLDYLIFKLLIAQKVGECGGIGLTLSVSGGRYTVPGYSVS